MFMTKYAQENKEDFQMQSLRLYSVVLKLLEGERCLRHAGYGFISYRELWEAGKSAGIFQSFESPFAVMMDMLTLMEEGGLVERVRVSGGELVWGGESFGSTFARRGIHLSDEKFRFLLNFH
ncbi:hypothetical protein [Bacillus sp. KH172YL63]|uniref:hypothetical protein n=1 Tax=Bacillus sp. KH172YL63 TaxID=2709784 RepID=UPI0013E46076|nr:hypothetical protein [Bacillus sp. KH172YL63]BCB04062.1 hypothetical protein KH172YL63_21950 [Bacillus sp. KH172YL63]